MKRRSVTIEDLIADVRDYLNGVNESTSWFCAVDDINGILDAYVPIKTGDYVIPNDPDTPDGVWTPCKVAYVYKNGSLYARSDKGDITWRGPVSGFKQITKMS